MATDESVVSLCVGIRDKSFLFELNTQLKSVSLKNEIKFVHFNARI